MAIYLLEKRSQSQTYERMYFNTTDAIMSYLNINKDIIFNHGFSSAEIVLNRVDEGSLIDGVTKNPSVCDDIPLKPYEIMRIGNLSLCKQTFLGRDAEPNEIEISVWDEAFQSRCTIAFFEENGLSFVGDRIVSMPGINFTDFKKLVQKRRRISGESRKGRGEEI